ncbi:24449_t:CDS:2, partial [Gigaspora rosea]
QPIQSNFAPVGAPIMEILYLNSSSYQHLYKNQRGPWSWSWNFQGPRSYVLNRPMRQSRGPGIVCSSARKVLYGDKEGGGSNLFREIGKVLEKSFKTSATSSVLVGKQDTTLSKGPETIQVSKEESKWVGLPFGSELCFSRAKVGLKRFCLVIDLRKLNRVLPVKLFCFEGLWSLLRTIRRSW